MKSRKKSARKGKKRGLRGLGLLCPAGAVPKAVGKSARCFRDGKMVAAVLEAMELSRIPPTVEFYTISGIGGLDLIENVRLHPMNAETIVRP